MDKHSNSAANHHGHPPPGPVRLTEQYLERHNDARFVLDNNFFRNQAQSENVARMTRQLSRSGTQRGGQELRIVEEQGRDMGQLNDRNGVAVSGHRSSNLSPMQRYLSTAVVNEPYTAQSRSTLYNGNSIAARRASLKQYETKCTSRGADEANAPDRGRNGEM